MQLLREYARRPLKQAALTGPKADLLSAAARRAAQAAGVPVSVTVLDADGHLPAFRNDDRAVLISGETSTRKAYTALQLDAPTAELTERVKPEGPVPQPAHRPRPAPAVHRRRRPRSRAGKSPTRPRRRCVLMAP
ncbi:pduO protein [Streptomyces laurentii]|uniref:PduO protein n=1 Tax=Streptomyces laurentii TaxID=39478 RepID=A0A160PA77_STRLU|nr:pduO protein [Streptomyces laurentii]